MGQFFEGIKEELDGLEDSFASDYAASRFGADYDSNPTVVHQVQAAINAMGYQPPLTVDGAYGPKTQAGVQWFQAQKGLDQDGVIGDQTLGALGIAPPSGISVQSVVGAATGALADVLNQFSSLVSWSAKNPQPLTQGRGIAPGFKATRASVINSFIDFNSPLEGWTTWMYLDELGWITTGMGNKIDPISDALRLPWKHADGTPATQAEIAAEWNAVDAHRTAAKGQQQNLPGGGAQSGWSSLRVSKADVQVMVDAMIKSNEGHILAAMPNFAQAPADAQMAVHSMSWAMGPGHFSTDFTHFTSAFNSGDYSTAADQSHMGGVGIDMRNMGNKLLLQNAAIVRAKGYNADTLYYLSGLAALFGAATGSPMALLRGMMSHKKATIGIAAGVVSLVGILLAILLGRAPAKAPPKLPEKTA